MCEVGTKDEGGASSSRYSAHIGSVVCRCAVGGGGGDAKEAWEEEEEGKGREERKGYGKGWERLYREGVCKA